MAAFCFLLPAVIEFALPSLPFALVAAAGIAGVTAGLLCVNRPDAGSSKARRRAITGLLVFAGLCIVAICL